MLVATARLSQSVMAPIKTSTVDGGHDHTVTLCQIGLNGTSVVSALTQYNSTLEWADLANELFTSPLTSSSASPVSLSWFPFLEFYVYFEVYFKNLPSIYVLLDFIIFILNLGLKIVDAWI